MKMITLMYHDVILDFEEISGFQNIGAIPYKILVSDFESQIKIIAEYVNNKSEYRDQIRLTFDDGGVSFYRHIAPVLERYNLKGCFFISTAFIGKQGFLTQEQIVQLHQRGHIIGVHSHNHPKNISALLPEEIEKEWLEAIRTIKEILSVENVIAASIPGGFFSNQSKKILFENGISYIFTSEPSVRIEKIAEKQFIIGRFAIQNGMTIKQFENILNLKSNQLYLIRFRWKTLGFIKRILGSNYQLLREILLKKKI